MYYLRMPMTILHLLLVSFFSVLVACGGEESGSSGVISPNFSFEGEKTSYSPSQIISITTNGPAEPELAQVYVNGIELEFHRIQESSFEYILAMPTLEPGDYTIDAVINGTLVSKTLTSLPIELGGATPSGYIEDILNELIIRLEALLDSDNDLGEFRQDIEATVADLKAIDIEAMTAAEVNELASIFFSNFGTVLNQSEAEAQNTSSEKYRITPSFDIEDCNGARNGYLFAVGQLGVGITASVFGAASSTLSGPLGLATTIAGFAVLYDAYLDMEKHAQGVVNHCVANLGDALLVAPVILPRDKTKPSENNVKPSSFVGTEIVLERFDSLTLSLQREVGVEGAVRDELKADSDRLRMRLLGFKSQNEDAKPTSRTSEKGFSIDSLAQSLIDIVNSLFVDEIADRRASEFTYTFNGVDVTHQLDGPSVVLTADISNSLASEEGTLVITDSADGHRSEFTVIVDQIPPVVCPDLAADTPLCGESETVFHLDREGKVSGKLSGFYLTGFAVDFSSLPGNFSIDLNTGEFEYTAPEGYTTSSGRTHGTLLISAINGQGPSEKHVAFTFKDFKEYYELLGDWQLKHYNDEERTDLYQTTFYHFDGNPEKIGYNIREIYEPSENSPDGIDNQQEKPYQEIYQSFENRENVNLIKLTIYFWPSNVHYYFVYDHTNPDFMASGKVSLSR